MYRILGPVAMIATPLAAAVLFGWELYVYLVERGVVVALAVVGGLGGAVAMESVGMFAGHIGIEGARRRNWPTTALAVVAMVVYAGFGWRTLPAYGFVFVLAALVYALVAAHQMMQVEDRTEQAQAADDRQNRRSVAAEKRRLAHELALRELELAHAAHPVAQATQSVVEDSHDTTYYECTCGKVFNKPQAYSAHTRWCDVYEPSANGHVS